MATTVAAKFHDETIHTFFLELGDQLPNIAGGTGVVLLAGNHCLVIHIETRHLNDADSPVAAIAIDRDCLLLRSLRLEFNFVPGQIQREFLGTRRGARWKNLQPHTAAAGTADEFDHVVESPADDIDDFGFRSLAYTDDAIIRF